MKFTLKQLYGYSIMNWKQFENRLEHIVMSRQCSFCIESNYYCNRCRIDHSICDMDDELRPTLYDNIDTARRVLEDRVRDLISALTKRYYEED